MPYAAGPALTMGTKPNDAATREVVGLIALELATEQYVMVWCYFVFGVRVEGGGVDEG